MGKEPGENFEKTLSEHNELNNRLLVEIGMRLEMLLENKDKLQGDLASIMRERRNVGNYQELSATLKAFAEVIDEALPS